MMREPWVGLLLFSWGQILKNKIILLTVFSFFFSSCIFFSNKKSANYLYKFIVGEKVRYKSNISIKYRVGRYGVGRSGSVSINFNTDVINRGVRDGINRLYLTYRGFRVEKKSGNVRFLISRILRTLRKNTVLFMDNKGKLKKVRYNYRNFEDSAFGSLFSYFLFPNLDDINQADPKDFLEFSYLEYRCKLDGITTVGNEPDFINWSRRINLSLKKVGENPIDAKLEVKQSYSKNYSLPMSIKNTIYLKMPLKIKTGFIDITTEANVIIELSLQKIDG